MKNVKGNNSNKSGRKRRVEMVKREIMLISENRERVKLEIRARFVTFSLAPTTAYPFFSSSLFP